MITSVVGFDEDSFRCAGELEHSCKQHSSKQTANDIHTAQLGQSKCVLSSEFGTLNLHLKA